ncbi:MAG: metal ABC transporter substrate-binding protein, partial [Gammaproteobacteria bacterium]
IYTVNYPLQYFAQRIAGEHAEVVFPAPPAIDPAFWTPDVQTVVAYQDADLILLNGANYAKWVNKVSLPRRRLVNTSAGFAENYIDTGSGAEHSHGSGAAHAHAGVAFTTWLDLQQAVLQADAIRQAIIKKRPQLKAEVDNNFARLEGDLLALDAELKSIIAGKQNQAILASHPVYQYLARRYGVTLHSVMWEPDEYPGPSQWQALANLAQGHAATWMLWEGEPATESVKQLKKMGIGSIVFDPCANLPAQGDFLSVMKNNLAALKQAF